MDIIDKIEPFNPLHRDKSSNGYGIVRISRILLNYTTPSAQAKVNIAMFSSRHSSPPDADEIVI